MSIGTIIVSGASSGIGLAISRTLLEQGYAVLGLSRHPQPDELDHTNYHAHTVDFSELDSLPATLEKIVASSSNLAGAVCCTGRGEFGSLEEFSYPRIRELIELNFTSQAYLARAIIPILKKRGHGDVIFLGSEAALKGSRHGSVYCASKFALRGFAQALRDECARSGVRICIINPGMVKTPFFDNLSFSHGEDEANYIMPNDIAQAVSMILSSRSDTVFDEINLSPRSKVILNKPE